jgi:hypothetical protein
MIPPEIRKTLMRLIERARDNAVDELERGKRSFRGLRPDQLAAQCGESGCTRQQILDELQATRDHIACAEAWLESQP